MLTPPDKSFVWQAMYHALRESARPDDGLPKVEVLIDVLARYGCIVIPTHTFDERMREQAE